MAQKTNVKRSPTSAASEGKEGAKETGKRPPKKMSEYGRQLSEKQKVKEMYGMRERQFRRFFEKAVKTPGAPGDNLLSFLERRLDNVIYRLKMAKTREQARQMVVHGLVLVNNTRVTAPSFMVAPEDVVELSPTVLNKKEFLEQVVDKRLKMGIKVPEWLELLKNERKGRVLRMPERADIQAPIEDQLIVELYSK